MKKITAIIILLFFVQWWLADPTISVPTNDVTFSYIVKYTEASNKNDLLPMLVALHGNGDTTENFYATALDELSVPVRMILLEGPIPKGTGNAWPWSPEDFKQYGEAVNEAVELLADKYPTTLKPVLLGFSGGGMMAYYQAVKHGSSYSYIFPISGKLSKDLLGDDLSSPGARVHAFHGKKDNVLSVSGGRNAVKLLTSMGINASLTEFDGGHLGIFKSMKTDITHAVEKKILSLN
ncbi:hypothetical protein MNBD_GAMMA15-1481 [hydrothermal vent metagenome]|uniref:Phospholipase/carboxylesterase/thioesterase domain-containing protein n=1 Tax=hydrothermal vent metagenome TaxID=652676 RepID=A0A3B0YM59_9ZZZZ